MRNLKSFVAAIAMAFGSISASAQCCCEASELGYKPYPYNFIQLQGGMGTVFTDVSAFDIMNPTFSVGVGRMFTPVVGARLHVNGYQSKGGFNKFVNSASTDVEKYKYNYINTNADLMLNLTNIISKKNYHLFNLYLIGGIGLNYAWDNSEFEALTSSLKPANDISNAWGDNQTPRQSLLGHNIRVGLLADFNIAKHWSVGVEVDANSLDDRFNSKYNNSDDWMLTAQLSLTYKFGFKKGCSKPAPEPVAPIVVAPEPEPVVVPEPTPEPAPKPVEVKEEPLREVIYYTICESSPNPQEIINKVVAWNKKYPNKPITVEGYADKGTGTPELNVGYAKSRAESVKKTLVAAGVPESILSVKSYGDTVQPFAENDKNRCVIIMGK